MKFLSSAAFFAAAMFFAASATFAQGSMNEGVGLKAVLSSDIDATVGDTLCFGLTARDEHGFIIRNWNETGSPVTIHLRNSTANTDSSVQTWNSDPDGYSWAKFYHNGVELISPAADEFVVPNDIFIDGEATICLIHTKTDTGVYFEIEPNEPFLNQVSETIDFHGDLLANYLVQITRPLGPNVDQVFQFRKYEVIVAPRDRFLNIIEGSYPTLFTARFPGEFVDAQPGLSNIFTGTVMIHDVTNYFIASTDDRELPGDQLQTITAYNEIDNTIYGITDPYEILNHAPYDFALLTLPDHTIINIGYSDSRKDTLTWERPNPPDPYTDIKISDFATAERGNDDVSYEIVFVDSSNLTHAQRFASDNLGIDPQFTFRYTQMLAIGNTMHGDTGWKQINLVWFVEATDGLYITRSTPPTTTGTNRGWHLTLNRIPVGVEEVPTAPQSFALEQNYPNPFNPSTTIGFSILQRGHVSLKVYDLVGNEVATLVSEQLSPGSYRTDFNATDLPSGVYIYKLNANGNTLTKRMVLAR